MTESTLPTVSTNPSPLRISDPTAHAILVRLDVLAGIAVIIWMAEAMVRLDLGAQVTAGFYAYFSLRFAMTAPRLIAEIRSSWPVFLLPVVALISVLWSIDPMTSFISAIQLAFTLTIAIFLGCQFGPQKLARILASGLLIALIASSVNLLGIWQPTHTWEGGFLGVFTNKNALGQRAALLLVTAVFLVANSAPFERLVWAATAALAGWMLLLSASATGILLGFSFAALLTLSTIWRARPGLRAIILILTTTALACSVLATFMLGLDLWAMLLDLFNKNSTLTGRTYLWQIALDKIHDRPLLGLGYMAYWTAPQNVHEVAVISDLYGSTVASFHNFALEFGVMLGLPGSLSIAFVAIWCLSQVIRTPRSAERGWMVLTLLMLLILSSFGSSFYRQHEITMLLIPALAASARRMRIATPQRMVSRTSEATIPPAQSR